MRDIAPALEPNRSVSSHPPVELTDVAAPHGAALPSIVTQARPPETGRRPRDVVAPRPGCSGRLDAVQAVGRVLAGEEDDVAVRRRFARMHHVGGDVDHRSGLGLDLLLADPRAKRALQNVDPLLVRMGMRLGAGPRRHAHQRHDHALAFDAGAGGGRITGTAENMVHLGEVEHVFAIARALGAGSPRCLFRHVASSAPTDARELHPVRRMPAPPRCRAAPAPVRQEWPTDRPPKPTGCEPAPRPPACPYRRDNRSRAARARRRQYRPGSRAPASSARWYRNRSALTTR